MVLSEKEKLLSEEKTIAQDQTQNLSAQLKQNAKAKMSLFVWEGFIRRLVGVSFDNDCLTLSAESDFHRDWLKDHYAHFFKEQLQSITGRETDIQFIHAPNNTWIQK